MLEPGDLVHETVGESVLRVPLAVSPRWELRRTPDQPRDDFFGLLQRQASLAQVQLSTPHPRMLLGAARAWRLGSLRCEWHGGFVVSARWSSGWTVRDSMAWHLWHLLASPAGVGLERFSGTPVDAADFGQTLEVIRDFPAPRLREVCFETTERLEPPRVVAGVAVERRPLGWLEIEHSPLPEHVAIAGPSNRLRIGWRQLVDVRVNGHTPGDCCVWHSGLWVELRAGDEVTWPGGGLRARDLAGVHQRGAGTSAR